MGEHAGLDVAAVRADLPALAGLVYLNTGTAGPLPRRVRDAMTAALDADLARGRASGRRFARIAEGLREARALLAGLVHADAAEIVLTTGTTDGIQRVLAAQPWSPGDHVLTTCLEHPDVLEAVRAAARRHNLHVDVAGEPEQSAEEIAASVLARIGRARLAVVSHVGYATGAVLPVERITAEARRHGALVLVDGAQAVGAIDVDVAALGADFYAFPGQKWLLAPEGTGALVVRGAGLPASGTSPGLLWAGLREAVRWRREHGHQDLLDAVARGAGLARRLLADIPGVRVLTPARHAGLVAFRVPGADPLGVAAELGARRIAVRGIPESDAVRLSCGPFTTEDELVLAARAVAEVTGR
ncbi:aminotransferase class V-fold PLP-dependent enzyme [Acrocarpospora catenulata]|uniref:aminotransferase class V-fold PLP-dependent enzyme n=1 Tax=Acrocarpospora catenulata TaxID=2836182 RepID=UPI001BDA299C|nr:aminotransferase class V-fold PLP-dependent enzyme [Acrocarpospora catenulata]